jgi:hypothetical protein
MARDVNKNIPVSSEMRDRLRACKRGGERYEDLFERLLDECDTVSHASDTAASAKQEG